MYNIIHVKFYDPLMATVIVNGVNIDETRRQHAFMKGGMNMAITAIFREVKKINKREMEEMKKQTAEDIFWQLGSIFCIDEAKYDAEKERYEQIMPFCTKLETADGQNVFVAKCEFLMMTSNKIVLNCMNNFSTEINGVYADVTEYQGQSIEGVATKLVGVIRSIDEPVKEELVKVKTKIPSPKEGGRIFYNVF